MVDLASQHFSSKPGCGALRRHSVLAAKFATRPARSVFKRVAQRCEKTSRCNSSGTRTDRKVPIMIANDYESVKSHIQELRQEAEHQQLVRAVSRRPHRHRNLRGRMLDWVGGKLIVWGQRLHTGASPSRSGSSW